MGVRYISFSQVKVPLLEIYLKSLYTKCKLMSKEKIKKKKTTKTTSLDCPSLFSPFAKVIRKIGSSSDSSALYDR